MIYKKKLITNDVLSQQCVAKLYNEIIAKIMILLVCFTVYYALYALSCMPLKMYSACLTGPVLMPLPAPF